MAEQQPPETVSKYRLPKRTPRFWEQGQFWGSVTAVAVLMKSFSVFWAPAGVIGEGIEKTVPAVKGALGVKPECPDDCCTAMAGPSYDGPTWCDAGACTCPARGN